LSDIKDGAAGAEDGVGSVLDSSRDIRLLFVEAAELVLLVTRFLVG
jgi:hypothetical protein